MITYESDVVSNRDQANPPPAAIRGQSYTNRNASRAALIVASTSASPCAALTNAASYCEGGSHTPRSSIARWNLPNRAVSLVAAVAKSTTCSGVKNQVTIEPIQFTVIGTPADLASAPIPTASCRVVSAIFG